MTLAANYVPLSGANCHFSQEYNVEELEAVRVYDLHPYVSMKRVPFGTDLWHRPLWPSKLKFLQYTDIVYR